MDNKKNALATPKRGVAVKPHKRSKPDSARNAVQKKVVVGRGSNTGKLVVAKVTGLKSHTMDTVKVLNKIKAGSPVQSFLILVEAYDATQKEMAESLSIPISTLNRRKVSGKLHTDESDRVVRFAKLKDDAVALMQGDGDAAISWLRTPQDILSGESPMAHASTELGVREVEALISRIRHGVFS